MSLDDVVQTAGTADAVLDGPLEDLEFDVCVDGVFVHECGSDMATAMTEAIRLRRESAADVITLVVSVKS